MIPKEKYDIVNRWSAEKLMGWRFPNEDRYENMEAWINPTTSYSTGYYIVSGYDGQEEFSPCQNLNHTKMVLDMLCECDKFMWAKALVNLCDPNHEDCTAVFNAPADLRMEAVLRVYFPDKTTEEAINEIEKGNK